MIQRLLLAYALLSCLSVAEVAAFYTTPLPRQTARVLSPIQQLHASPESAVDIAAGEIEEDYDVTCYVVNDEEIVTEGEKPHVVCTSEPDDVS